MFDSLQNMITGEKAAYKYREYYSPICSEEGEEEEMAESTCSK